MTIIGTMLTALVVAREWERGTMEAVLSTPASVMEILIGKLLPYFVLGMLSTLGAAALAVFVFDVPLRGSLAAQIGRASCRERVCQYVSISVVAVSLKKKKNII